MKTIAITILLLLAGRPLVAQDVDQDGEILYLIPVNVPEPVQGAHGSEWVTQVWLHNGTELPIDIGGCPGDPEPPCSFTTFSPGTTAEYIPLPGARLYEFPADTAGRVLLSSRLFELSRQSQPVGVELPVVREDEFFFGPSRFIAVPSGLAVRSALRVYDPRGRAGGDVRVEVVNAAGVELGEMVLPLVAPIESQVPSMAFVPDIVLLFPQLLGVDRYDVIVTPLDAGMEYWAFVNVTDNVGQQVFTITSQWPKEEAVPLGRLPRHPAK